MHPPDRRAAPSHVLGLDLDVATAVYSRLLRAAAPTARPTPEAARTYEERCKQVACMDVSAFACALESLPDNLRAGTIDHNLARAFIDLLPTFVDRANERGARG